MHHVHVLCYKIICMCVMCFVFIADPGKLSSNLDWTSANAVKVEHHLGNLFDDSDEDELQTVSSSG